MSSWWILTGTGLLSVAVLAGAGYLKQTQNRLDRPPLTEQGVRRLAQFFYYVGLPYLTIILGILSPHLLGLTGLEYFNLINWRSQAWAIQLQQATTLMLLEWLLDSQETIFAGGAALLLFTGLWLLWRNHQLTPVARSQSIIQTIYQALHWAFYRAIFWALTADLYLGVVLGSSLIILEWTLTYNIARQPFLQKPQFFIDIIVLVFTATIFFYSPNLWLLLPIHWVMVAMANNASQVTTKEAF